PRGSRPRRARRGAPKSPTCIRNTFASGAAAGTRKRSSPSPTRFSLPPTTSSATEVPYQELGGDYFVRREDQERLTRRLVRQLERLGQSVTLKPALEVR